MKHPYPTFRALLLLALILPAAPAAQGQKSDSTGGRRPRISGTVRAKAEYQFRESESRFEVRNARVALEGDVLPTVAYKAEIDLSDEGQIKMLDAYGELRPLRCRRPEDRPESGMLALRMGQMRVPFSIDAHRSPHRRLFANRSFIAKQVGDVGLMAAYRSGRLPLTLEAGAFSGSGLTAQKDYWTKRLNYSAKVSLDLPCGLSLQLSTQKVSPSGGAVYLYDGGATLRRGRWMLEAEYLRKHYANRTFADVDAFDTFACYRLPLRRHFDGLSFLARFDMMGDHSDGSADGQGALRLTDAARRRLTGGLTLHLAKRIEAELRLNCEKYFYDRPALAKPSERDKLVVELMVHF